MSTRSTLSTFQNENRCKFCGCEQNRPCCDAKGNPCFWVDGKCSVCSCCAKGKGVMVKRVLEKSLKE